MSLDGLQFKSFPLLPKPDLCFLCIFMYFMYFMLFFFEREKNCMWIYFIKTSIEEVEDDFVVIGNSWSLVAGDDGKVILRFVKQCKHL